MVNVNAHVVNVYTSKKLDFHIKTRNKYYEDASKDFRGKGVLFLI